MAAKDLYDKDLYKILGVSKNDDEAKVKSAYRKLAKDLHPDKTKGDRKLEERFKEVSEAYEVLSDKKKRAEYEEMRTAMSNASRARSNAKPSGFGFQPGPNDAAPGYGDYADIFGGVSGDDLFSSLFGGASRQPRRGSDLQTEITISFRDSILGMGISLKIEHESIKIRIPAGINDSAKIKVKGRGAEGAGGVGDLFVIVHVEPHPIFTRKENDLVMNLPVSFSEVALGADVLVPTFSGEEVTVRIPAGTRNGKILRIKGKGVKKGNVLGDLLIKVDIQVPQKLSAKARQALEEFASTDEGKSQRAGLREQVKL